MPNMKFDRLGRLEGAGKGKGQRVTAEEGVRILAKELLDTTRRAGDVASEETWQGHAILLLRHGEHFMAQVGMAGVLKMQQQCADMIIKIRLSQKKAPRESLDTLEEYEGMLAEIFANEPEPGEPPIADTEPDVPHVVPSDEELEAEDDDTDTDEDDLDDEEE